MIEGLAVVCRMSQSSIAEERRLIDREGRCKDPFLGYLGDVAFVDVHKEVTLLQLRDVPLLHFLDCFVGALNSVSCAVMETHESVDDFYGTFVLHLRGLGDRIELSDDSKGKFSAPRNVWLAAARSFFKEMTLLLEEHFPELPRDSEYANFVHSIASVPFMSTSQTDETQTDG